MRHQFDRLLDLLHVALELGLVTSVRKILRLGIDASSELDVLRDIDHHRSRPPARGDVECLVQDARQILDALDQVIIPVSYTHLRAHATVLDLVCRLLLEKKKKNKQNKLT